MGIGTPSPATALDVTGTVTADIVAISDELTFEGAAGGNALLQKSLAIDVVTGDGRDELQIYAAGDAYSTNSLGSGIHLYGNSDPQHAGAITLLTGTNGNGDARLMVSGRDTTTVTIGNGIFDYVDNGLDHALLNLKDPSGQPALLIEGASGTEGDIVTVDGESMQFGHWNKTSTTFTERMAINSSGNIVATGSITSDTGLLAGAGAAAGAVGTYAFLIRNTAYVVFGSTYGGGGLRPAGLSSTAIIATTNAFYHDDESADLYVGPGTGTAYVTPGTWRCMGQVTTVTGMDRGVTLFLRIA